MDLNPVDVESYLRGVQYPVRKDELIATAEQDGAPQEVIEALQALDDEQFEAPSEVQAALH